MASIESSGFGAALDVNSIVSQLMAIERRPLFQLARQEAEYQAEISAFGSLKSAVSQLRSAAAGLGNLSTFQAMKVSASDGDVLSVSTDESAGFAADVEWTVAGSVTPADEVRVLVTLGWIPTTSLTTSTWTLQV